MKAKRQMKIIELVSQNVVTSQEALCRALAKEGIKVTQATVSRDIKELNLVRVPSGDGRYKYALMPGDPSSVYCERFKKLFSDCCLDMERSNNIILVKTIEATAQAVGQAIDALNLPDILGCVAGDDAVLVVVREGHSSQEALDSLRKIAGL